jgi:hypothetical protein
MRNYIILALFILISVQGFAQGYSQKTLELEKKVDQILDDNGVITYRSGGVETKDGSFYIYIIENRIRTMADVKPSRVFFYSPDKKLTELPSLKGYIIEDYSEKRNQILIGKMDVVGDRSVLCAKHYTYDLATKNLTLQYDLNADNHRDMFGSVIFTESKDSIIVHNVNFYRTVKRDSTDSRGLMYSKGERIMYSKNVIRKLK